MMRRIVWAGAAALAMAWTLTASAQAAQQVTLAANGQAKLAIVMGDAVSDRLVARQQVASFGQGEWVEEPSSQRLRILADTLADYLGRISGATFSVEQGDGTRGIAVGLFSDFPALGLADRFDPDNPLRREEYLIRSHEGGLYLIGATELAAEHAVWDLLHRLGYRQFFPGKTWEIIPHTPELTLAVDSFEQPDYHSRLIWYGGGMTDDQLQAYTQWTTRNRATAGFRLNTSHEYDSIRKRNPEAFKAHPEYVALVDGERKIWRGTKFEAANEGLQQLVEDDALAWFKANPHEVSKSMDPSDFGGWPKEGPSAELGSPTDQALTLANRVAEAANRELPGERYVGMYAYYDHQAPPNIAVNPKVIVSFATRFLKPGMVVDELIAGWRAKGLQLWGVREYYGVFIWEWDIASLSVQGANLDYLTHTIPDFHRRGARFLTAESSAGSGAHGLGYYLATRMLWDVDEAQRADALVADFLDKAFGPAQEPMARFYQLLNGDDRPRLRDGMVGHLYSILAEAREAAQGNTDVLARVNDLVLYVRYLELMRDYQLASGEARQAAFEAVVRHTYRMRSSMMVHTAAVYDRNYIARFDKSVQIPAEAEWEVPEAENPWKSSEPFSEQELAQFVAAGVQAYQAYTASRPRFALAAPVSAGAATQAAMRVRDNAAYALWAEAGDRVRVDIACSALGFSFGPSFQLLGPDDQVLGRGRAEVGEPYPLEFTARQTGTHLLVFDTTPNGLRVTANRPLAMLAQDHLGTWGGLHLKRPVGELYFHVPAGVERVELKVLGQGKGELVQAALLNPAGEVVEQRDKISGLEPWTISVPRDHPEHAEQWSIRLDRPSEGYFGDVYVELSDTLPPVLATQPDAVFRFAK